MRPPSLVLGLLIFALILSEGCASTLYLQDEPDDPQAKIKGESLEELATHVIMLNKKGRFEPIIKAEGDYSKQLEKIIAAMHKQNKNKILIYIHGGLNSKDESRANAIEHIKKFRDSDYYPIFINWESSLPSSYGEHLTSVRQGKRQFELFAEYLLPDDESHDIAKIKAIEGWSKFYDAVPDSLSIPFIFLKDLFRGLIRAPMTTYSLAVASGFEQLNSLSASPCGKNPSPDLRLKRGCNVRTIEERASSEVLRNVTTGGKLFSAFMIDAFGEGAWNNMQRRTKLLFHAHPSYLANYGAEPDCASTDGSIFHELDGDLSKFLCRLRLYINSNKERGWTITLVGHSMGAIIQNEILRRFPDLPFDHLVYMAPASSILDWESAVLPYLRLYPRAEAHVLMLHHQAELEETEAGDLPIRGSLLVWVDEFLASPLVPLDRTAGRIVNWRGAWHHLLKKLRNRITFQEFNFGYSARCRHPQRHGDFKYFPFWEPAFWFGDNRPARVFIPEDDLIGTAVGPGSEWQGVNPNPNERCE